MTKKLQELLSLLPEAEVQGSIDKTITDVVYDSRKVIPGSMFICLPGAHVDGHNFVQQAAASGATCLLVEKDVKVSSDITIIKVENTRLAMQAIAPYFFDYPGKKLRMIGVTGTNGKTTITYLIRAILMEKGYKVGVIGTIHTLIDNEVLPVKNTTPDVVDLQKTLAMMVECGVEYVVMEVSSHALDLGRVAGCEYDVGVFTNMTRDHLDFHITFENYIEAKAKLFKVLKDEHSTKANKFAVVNLDDAASEAMIRVCSCPVLTYSVNHVSDLQAKDIEIKAKGSMFHIKTKTDDISLKLRLTGIFNVYNVLAAVGVGLGEKIDIQVIKTALEKFVSVPGRFELVEAGQEFTVIVDYAHTPDGLENVLKTAREFTKGKLIAVFGCGGDRDRTKRPIMGKLAVNYADIIIATSDNPRSEDPDSILDEIEVGIKEVISVNKSYEKICDRRQAIKRAIELAQDDDVVLIAGKGHETYQILKDKTIDFDDRQVVRDIIGEMR